MPGGLVQWHETVLPSKAFPMTCERSPDCSHAGLGFLSESCALAAWVNLFGTRLTGASARFEISLTTNTLQHTGVNARRQR
jgi:hypothetical protein